MFVGFGGMCVYVLCCRLNWLCLDWLFLFDVGVVKKVFVGYFIEFW